ncbi:YlxR family protein [Alkalibacter rhizosphaerae]|uniref:YlxR family protein n=1 Tax=Alkalibacter rhizosphaerae TaxID=2815577 RepID=A0A974XHC9_9FIRM|nr:YlxR family protein [Alkalibacter rhizosphaerae]QSX08690.1 YlxR family protein [Alkalibacter rhizosphaerae]
MKKIPQRTCIVCGNKIDKRNLVRVVKNKEGRIFFDPTGKANGRGAYLCGEDACIEGILKKNALNRAFKTDVAEEDKIRVMEEIKNGRK